MKHIRKLIWFIASRLIIACILIGMLICAFFMGLNLANVYTVLDEGLEKRADVILTRDDAEELNKYFTYDFLNADVALSGAFDGTSVYADYRISDFEYELKIEKMWSWPWDNYATCTVVERIPVINGSVVSSRASEVPKEIPKWQGGRYNLTLVRDGTKWKIGGMQQTNILLESDHDDADLLMPVD
ncbi:MAG: hypothetical protein MJ099_00605 [Clostridia bacterium]|nr:hypothetical protein [Clostridia bacterium]